MITGIVIPHDEMAPLEERTFNGLPDYQSAVGGWIEAILLHKPSMTLFVNEEGKIRGLPRNSRATVLWWLLTPAARQLDFVVGDAVLVGSRGGSGSTTELPQVFRALVLETPNYAVEVTDGRGRWQRDRQEFGSYFEAAVHAMILLRRSDYPGPVDTRARVVGA
jgi:hypothetical protein